MNWNYVVKVISAIVCGFFLFDSQFSFLFHNETFSFNWIDCIGIVTNGCKIDCKHMETHFKIGHGLSFRLSYARAAAASSSKRCNARRTSGLVKYLHWTYLQINWRKFTEMFWCGKKKQKTSNSELRLKFVFFSLSPVSRTSHRVNDVHEIGHILSKNPTNSVKCVQGWWVPWSAVCRTVVWIDLLCLVLEYTHFLPFPENISLACNFSFLFNFVVIIVMLMGSVTAFEH